MDSIFIADKSSSPPSRKRKKTDWSILVRRIFLPASGLCADLPFFCFSKESRPWNSFYFVCLSNEKLGKSLRISLKDNPDRHRFPISLNLKSYVTTCSCIEIFGLFVVRCSKDWSYLVGHISDIIKSLDTCTFWLTHYLVIWNERTNVISENRPARYFQMTTKKNKDINSVKLL